MFPSLTLTFYSVSLASVPPLKEFRVDLAKMLIGHYSSRRGGGLFHSVAVPQKKAVRVRISSMA